MIDRQISIPHVVSNRVFTSSEEALDIVKLLTKSAIELNQPKVLVALGHSEGVGVQYSDILDNVPEVIPVLRYKVSRFS